MKGYTSFMAPLFGVNVATKPIGDMKYLDWEKAKQLIKEHPDSIIYAGLMEDWNNTSGLIYAMGDFYYDGYVYGASCWATPILDIDGEEVECWTYEETKEGSGKPDWLYGNNIKDAYDFWTYEDEAGIGID